MASTFQFMVIHSSFYDSKRVHLCCLFNKLLWFLGTFESFFFSNYVFHQLGYLSSLTTCTSFHSTEKKSKTSVNYCGFICVELAKKRCLFIFRDNMIQGKEKRFLSTFAIRTRQKLKFLLYPRAKYIS